MYDTNIIVLVGRLTRDPEIVKTATQTFYKSTIATNPTGDPDKTSFIDIIAKEKQGEALYKYCKKGSQIAITGNLSVYVYTDKNGSKQKSVGIYAWGIQFMDKKPHYSGDQDSKKEPAGKIAEKEYDPKDIPF
jgi:single-strand DNA-binding protein